MKPVGGSVPRYQTMKNQVRDLKIKLTWKYSKFILSPQEHARIRSMFKEMLKKNLLTNNPVREKQWIGIVLVKRIVTSYIHDAIRQGSLSWDVVVYKILSIILMSTLGVRAGDAVRSSYYFGNEFLRWGAITIKFRSTSIKPLLEDLVLQIVIEYEKGAKNRPAKNRVALFDFLTMPEDNIVCPIKWILIHALRHGLIKATVPSLEAVLQETWGRNDRTIQWTQPQWPVLTAIHGLAFLDLDIPARVNQISNSLRYGGLLAGILASLTSHDSRRGAFRDVAAMSGKVRGLASESVAETYGHSGNARTAGVTKLYVGGNMDSTLLHQRLRSDFMDDFGVQVCDQSYPNKRMTKEQIDEYCTNHDLDPSNRLARQIASNRIRKEDVRIWIDDAKNGVRETVPANTHGRTGRVKCIKIKVVEN